MSVHQTTDGRWYVVIPPRPDRPRKKEYFGRGIEAELAAHARNHALGLGKHHTISQKEADFIELGNEYLKTHGVDMRPTSRDDAAYKLDATIYPAIGHLPGSKIGPSVLDAYVIDRVAAGRKKTTIHRELSIIKAILRWAVSRHLIAGNPMASYQMPTRDDAIIAPPTAAELSAIYQHAAPHLRRALLLAYFTGARPGGSELFALRWEHVDLISGSIFVESAKKGGLRSRVVPIASALAEQMRQWIVQDKQLGPLGWVVHFRGAQVGSIKTAWARAKDRAGITRKLRPYDLRHMCATQMLAAGADLKSVSEILGHASPDLTLKTYQHTMNAQRIAAVAVLGEHSPIIAEKNKVFSEE